MKAKYLYFTALVGLIFITTGCSKNIENSDSLNISANTSDNDVLEASEDGEDITSDAVNSSDVFSYTDDKSEEDNSFLDYKISVDEFDDALDNAAIGDEIVVDGCNYYDYSGSEYAITDDNSLSIQGIALKPGTMSYTIYTVDETDGEKTAVPIFARLNLMPADLLHIKGIVRFDEGAGEWYFYPLYEEGDGAIPIFDTNVDTSIGIMEFNGNEYKVHPRKIVIYENELYDFAPEQGREYLVEVDYEGLTIDYTYSTSSERIYNYFYDVDILDECDDV